MPELPEVETLRRGLASAVCGRRIEAVEVRERRLRRRLARSFAGSLLGRRIDGVRRRGKYLLFDLDDGSVWMVHLGMSGSLTVMPAVLSNGVHTHVIVTLDDGRTLRFHDPRRFGLMRVGVVGRLVELAALGVEPLDPGFSTTFLHEITRGRRRAVKSLLMDQRIVAGLGNIYVNEILFAAGIRPGRCASRLSRADAARIVDATGAVLGEALASRGSSISDYRDECGRPGAFQERFRVYERAGQACVRCGNPIRRLVIVGRSSFFCPRCQR